MFDRKKFHELEAKFGPFTLDAAAAVDGSNAQCKKFCSPANSFLKAECNGETIWMNPPFDRIDEFLGHYRAQKNKHTSIAGVLVWPRWEDAHWSSKTLGWTEVCTFRKGTLLFTAPPEKGQLGGRRHLGPTQWPVVVFYDAPQPSVQPPSGSDSRVEECTPSSSEIPEDTTTEFGGVNNAQPTSTCQSSPDQRRKLLITKGRIGKKSVTVLFDSGAAMDLLDATVAKQLGIQQQRGDPVEISMAGGQVQDASHVCTAERGWKSGASSAASV